MHLRTLHDKTVKRFCPPAPYCIAPNECICKRNIFVPRGNVGELKFVSYSYLLYGKLGNNNKLGREKRREEFQGIIENRDRMFFLFFYSLIPSFVIPSQYYIRWTLFPSSHRRYKRPYYNIHIFGKIQRWKYKRREGRKKRRQANEK